MYCDTLVLEAPQLFLAVSRNRLAGGLYHAPPGQPDAVRKNIAHRACGAGKAGTPRYLAIADHLTATQIPDCRGDGYNKGAANDPGGADESEANRACFTTSALSPSWVRRSEGRFPT